MEMETLKKRQRELKVRIIAGVKETKLVLQKLCGLNSARPRPELTACMPMPICPCNSVLTHSESS